MQTSDSDTDILMGEARKRAQPRIVVGIAAYNIEGVIEKIASSLNPIADEIMVCDDASTDSTAKIADSLNCKMIMHPHRLGPAATMRSLFLAASQDHADVLLTVATDTICDSGDLSKLVDSVTRHEADIAVGCRTPLKSMSASENFGRAVLTVFGLPVQDPKSPFKAYGKAAISAVIASSAEKPDILPESKKLGLGVMEYQISPKPLAGAGLKARKVQRQNPIGQMVTFTALKHPLVFYTVPSILALIGALVTAYLTYEYWISGYGFSLLGVIASVALFLIWVILGVAGAILHSIGASRESQYD
jgi:glycosyltransferase involved in cell wall biosynthesis